MTFDWEGTVYGVVLDDEGSMDYYPTLAEAQEYGHHMPIAKVTTRILKCICHSYADSRCELHGY